MLESYQLGITPNPDILCNKFIKFGAFSRYAFERLGADAIATGHYARSNFGCFLERRNSEARYELHTAADLVKDQTFWLSQVPFITLSKVVSEILISFRIDRLEGAGE